MGEQVADGDAMGEQSGDDRPSGGPEDDVGLARVEPDLLLQGGERADGPRRSEHATGSEDHAPPQSVPPLDVGPARMGPVRHTVTPQGVGQGASIVACDRVPHAFVAVQQGGATLP